jgi:protein PhnA
MDETLPPCPECASEFTYESGALLTCPLCAHEWSPVSADDSASDGNADDDVIRDAFGTILTNGDTVTVIKDLKVKGSPYSVKVGTKVRGIRLVQGVGDHDIDCKVEGFGQMQLKSSVVKKV